MHILLVNMSALILGTVIGCLLKKYVPEKLQENSMIYFSIVTLVLGIRLIERTTSFSAVVIAFLIGGTIGHFLRLDDRVAALPQKLAGGRSGFDAGTLMTGFTLYCVSTSGILGAMDLGLSGDTTLLMIKAVMDLLAAVFFAAAGAGWMQLLIAVPLGIVLFGFYFLSKILMPYVTPEMIGDFSSCGGADSFGKIYVFSRTLPKQSAVAVNAKCRAELLPGCVQNVQNNLPVKRLCAIFI